MRNNFLFVTTVNTTKRFEHFLTWEKPFFFSYTVRLYTRSLQNVLWKEENIFELCHQCAKTVHDVLSLYSYASSWNLVWCCFLCCPLLLTFEWSMLQILLIWGFFFWLRPEAYSNAARVIFWCFWCCSCILVLFQRSISMLPWCSIEIWIAVKLKCSHIFWKTPLLINHNYIAKFILHFICGQLS